MPPRKVKNVQKEIPVVITETPVIFFLRIGEEDIDEYFIPANKGLVSYSEILNTFEVSRNT